MSKFLNLVAFLPIFSFIVTIIYFLLAKEEIYINYHWLIVALLSIQASAERLKNVNSVNRTIFVSSILANIFLLIASGFDLKITSVTIELFIIYLSIGFLLVMGNLAVNWYNQQSTNKQIN